ncbi:Protein vts1 [Paramyrothecium foliicola]|nr:Protein vts1 [Paramyrothecium foliicola]
MSDCFSPTISPGYATNLESVLRWFSTLNKTERILAVTTIAQLPPHQVASASARLPSGHRAEQQMDWPPEFPHDADEDPRWLRKWLKKLRLHKYEESLAGLRPEELLNLDDESLQQLGIDTVGARKKFLRVLELARGDIAAKERALEVLCDSDSDTFTYQVLTKMAISEFFSLDRHALGEQFKQADTETLQRLEIQFMRDYLANCGSAALGVATTAKTMGAAFPLPLYSGRMAHIAEVKLELVQLQLTARSVQLHVFNWRDAGHVGGSLAAGQVVGGIIDYNPSGIEEAVNPDPSGVEVRAEIGKAIPSEAAQMAYLAATRDPPPKTCPRPKRYRFQRLKCAECKTHFDTSYSDWIHCCQCKDLYDICMDCAKKTKHNPQHQLYHMRGERPKPQTSVRGFLGVRVKCAACKTKMPGLFYTYVVAPACEECFGECDICMSCYSEGYCQEFAQDGIKRFTTEHRIEAADWPNGTLT